MKKKSVNADHHTIIYTEKPVAARGEKDRGLTKKPIRVVPSSPRHKLDNFSRLNYAKTYMVEYNVKVCKYPYPGIIRFFSRDGKILLQIRPLTLERVHRKSSQGFGMAAQD